MKLLSEKDVASCLARLAERRRVMETSLATVVQGYCPAAFVWGPPGMGKSYVVRNCLNGLLATRWKHHTAYTTPKGLMLTLAEDSAAIHVFEDCERMLRTDLTASILRAACGSPNEQERWVTYETANERLRVKLTGGIIVVTNANLSKSAGPMQGVASRFRPIEWTMTQEEVVASIQQIAKTEFVYKGVQLSSKNCMLVAKALVDMIGEEDMSMPLDLRLYTEHALPTFAYCQMSNTGNWLDVLRAKLIGKAGTAAEGQAQRTQRLQSLALSIKSDSTLKPKERVAKWKALTGLGQAIYYRHLKGSRS